MAEGTRPARSTSIVRDLFRISSSRASFESNAPTEDRFDLVDHPGHVYAAVYDGHGGTKTAQYLQEQFYSHIFAPALAERAGDASAAFEAAIPAADSAYTDKAKKDRDWQALFTGSCLVACYVDKKRMAVTLGNCGDSRAVMGQEEDGGILSALQLTSDHSADMDDERHRVRAAFPNDKHVVEETWDEYVLEYSHRVKQFARFTRSIGDVQLKDPECARKFNSLSCGVKIEPLPSRDTPYILATPQVVFHQLHRKDKFLIIASDGLWDEISSDQAVFATGHFIEQYGKEADIASHLLEYCLSKIAARLALEEPELGLSTVEGVKSMPPGKNDPKEGTIGRRGLMDDQTIIVLVFDENVQLDNARPGSVADGMMRSGRSRGRKSTQDWLETMDGVSAKLEADTPTIKETTEDASAAAAAAASPPPEAAATAGEGEAEDEGGRS